MAVTLCELRGEWRRAGDEDVHPEIEDIADSFGFPRLDGMADRDEKNCWLYVGPETLMTMLDCYEPA